MNKLIINFHDYDGTLVRRTITNVEDGAAISYERAISRAMSTMFRSDQNKVYSATVYWENNPMTSVYDYTPGLELQWKYTTHYVQEKKV